MELRINGYISKAFISTFFSWALVKDQEVARRMIKFIELTTIGVSKDAQLRAAKILRVISDSSERTASSEQDESFFEFSHHLLAKRWKLLREAVEHSEIFSLPVFLPAFCTFRNRVSEPQPGNATHLLYVNLIIYILSSKVDVRVTHTLLYNLQVSLG